MRFAQIITDISYQKIDRPFTYSVPAELSRRLAVGMRVVVPFGKSKSVTGYVLDFCDESPLEIERIKPILRIVEDYPVLTKQQLELAKIMQRTYRATLAQVIRLMIPPGLRSGSVKEKTVTAVSLLCPEKVDEAAAMMREGTKKQKIVLFLAEHGECSKSRLEEEIGGVDAPLRQLDAAGIVAITKQRLARNPYGEMVSPPKKWLPLHTEQKNALEAICRSIDSGSGDILLHGVTGSGKTEVYMRAIRHVLDMGGSAIMLIPEISLTPQTVGRFRERFGDSVAVLHSALSEGERFDEWQRIRFGQAKVVVGARSAIFAPCERLKLIIIDEAHESSYIAGSHPEYNAVEVARELACLHGGVLVLGSATPSVEQYYNAQNGMYSIVKMNTRINGRELPRVEVVDMASELASGNKSLFSRKLFSALERTIDSGHQAILFLNRRGHSTVVTCRSCGETVKCPNCDISMTYHISDVNSVGGANRLRCHYCGAEMPYPTHCPSCGSKYIKFMGAGTEKVEQECNKLFPGVPVLRMDNDTTRTKDAHYHILSAFAEGKAQILIGTQMIAKGLDFPKVSLVGIVSADTMLQLPDYTSREKTYSLITQVAGRAGRAQTGGEVILQTYTPKHYAIADAVNYKYDDFYTRELAMRKNGMYPPFSRMLRLIFSSEDQNEARSACYTFFLRLRDAVSAVAESRSTVLYLNMMTAPIGRIKGKFRFQILLKMKTDVCCEQLTDMFFDMYNAFDNAKVLLDAEINPTGLY